MQALLRKEEGVGGPGMLPAAQRALSDLKPELGTPPTTPSLPSVSFLIPVPESLRVSPLLEISPLDL